MSAPGGVFRWRRRFGRWTERPACRILLAILLALQAGPARSMSSGSDKPPLADASQRVAARADALVALFNAQDDPARLFTPEFLAQVPASKVRAVAAALVARLGRATAIHPSSPDGSTWSLRFEHGVATLKIVVEPAGEGRISGLLITRADDDRVASPRSLDEVAAAFKTLPGRTGFVVADLGPAVNHLVAHEADRPLAIGSTFKLAVLAELVLEIDGGQHRWEDDVVVDGNDLPAGAFNGKPAGTRINLRYLVEEMIRVSDNSAADLVLRTLGREHVEAVQSQIGIRAPSANRPFLTTMEAFKLKWAAHGTLGQRYLALDEAGRRRLLAELAGAPAKGMEWSFGATPALIDHVEWFASPADLARIMLWFRDHGRTPAGAEALRILARNPGLPSEIAGRFAYVGYKGGSEPGVISTTMLLQTKAQLWRVVSATWNDDKPVDELMFIGLVHHAARLAAELK